MSQRRILPILITVTLLGVIGGVVLFHNLAGSPTPRPKTAAIVDQLGLTYPNPAFVQAATDILIQADYTVTYIPGEQVTVELYRNLPAQVTSFIGRELYSYRFGNARRTYRSPNASRASCNTHGGIKWDP